jgi:hypothetical protein
MSLGPCIHCHLPASQHAVIPPYYCISSNYRQILNTVYTPETQGSPAKMLNFYQLNDFNRDVVSLKEAKIIVDALKEYTEESLHTLPTEVISTYDSYCNFTEDNKKKSKYAEREAMMFTLTWLVRKEADQRARKQTYSENYPFTYEASKLGLTGGSNAS